MQVIFVVYFFLRRCLTIEDVFEVAAASFVQRQQVRALGQVGDLELGRQEVLEDEGPLRVPLDHVESLSALEGLAEDGSRTPGDEVRRPRSHLLESGKRVRVVESSRDDSQKRVSDDVVQTLM